jgi:hypothetical protein
LRLNCGEVFWLVQIELSPRPGNSLHCGRVSADEVFRAPVSRTQEKLWKERSGEDRRDAGPSRVDRSGNGDFARGGVRGVPEEQRAKVFDGEAGLIADQEQNGLRWGIRFADRLHAGAQRGAHALVPGGIEDGCDGESVQFGLHLGRVKAENDEDGGTTGLEGESGGAAEEGFAFDTKELFGPAESSGGSGCEEDRSAAEIRHERA